MDADRTELLAEGRHLFDLTVAEGMDSGRYRVTPGHDARILPGPTFSTIAPSSWAERLVDSIVGGGGRVA